MIKLKSKLFYYIFVGVLGLMALLVVGARFPVTGYQILVVQSGSMAPTIKVGAVVIVRPASNYLIGDVITFKSQDGLKSVTHRIHEMYAVKGEPFYITKGDANDHPDTRQITGPEIIGKVIISLPLVGYLVEAARQPLGLTLLIVIPAGAIIIEESYKIFKQVRKKTYAGK